jgi:hypothetical protein
MLILNQELIRRGARCQLLVSSTLELIMLFFYILLLRALLENLIKFESGEFTKQVDTNFPRA